MKKFRLDAIIGLSFLFGGDKTVKRSGMIYYIRQQLLLWFKKLQFVWLRLTKEKSYIGQWIYDHLGEVKKNYIWCVLIDYRLIQLAYGEFYMFPEVFNDINK